MDFTIYGDDNIIYLINGQIFLINVGARRKCPINIYIYIYILNLFGAPWCPGTIVEIEYIPNSNEYETFSIT
jgi:hypothetical protein